MTEENVLPQFIIGIGASAGGLDALERFFSQVPEDTNLAYVVIQHLAPDFESLMPELLSRKTNLPISPAEDGMQVKANHIYLNTPRQALRLENGRLCLRPHTEDDSSVYHPINIFFRSLAVEMDSQSICVVLSGTGSDGTQGAIAVRDAKGLVITQDVNSAKYASMPSSAAESGPSDLVLKPEDMAEAIVNYTKFDKLPVAEQVSQSAGTPVDEHQALARLYAILQARYGIDFTLYRSHTIERRIERRMKLMRINTLGQYLDLQERDPKELEALYRDVLLDVTHFFRDTEAFDVLESLVIPEIVAAKAKGDQIRIWVAGCASGEEAYSLGILFLEEIEKQQKEVSVKIFATDAHPDSIARAGKGEYPAEKIKLIPEAIRQKYFQPLENGQFKVTGALRLTIIFAVHNLLVDAHFTRLDFLSCRNVLIYLKSDVQKRLFTNFNQALCLKGTLFLGKSESLGEFGKLYKPINRQRRIFQKIATVSKQLRERLAPVNTPAFFSKPLPKYAAPMTPQLETKIINSLVTSGFLVDENGHVVHMYGDVNRYIQFAEGHVNLNLSNILVESLAAPVRVGLYRAQKSREKVILRGIALDPAESEDLVDVVISMLKMSALQADSATFYFVSLVPASALGLNTARLVELDLPDSEPERMEQLEREIIIAQENLQATVEEIESTNEELQTSNEELIASNEELQSTNEELSAVNEELYSTNQEYQLQNQVYIQLNSDMVNLMAASQVLIVLLDKEFCLRVISPYAQKIFGFVDTDIGRLVTQFNLFNDLSIDKLEQFLDLALKGETVTRRVHNKQNFPFTLQLSPYMTHERIIDGVTMFCSDAYIDLDKLDSFFAKPASFQALSPEHPSCMLVHDFKLGQIVFAGGPLLASLDVDQPDEINYFVDLLHRDDTTDLAKVFEEEIKNLKDGEINRRTHLLRQKDGSSLLCRVNEGVYGRGHDGKLTQSMLVITPFFDPL
ncbi:MAG: chemotaxis protein CheB [Chloroflexota bacterium]